MTYVERVKAEGARGVESLKEELTKEFLELSRATKQTSGTLDRRMRVFRELVFLDEWGAEDVFYAKAK